MKKSSKQPGGGEGGMNHFQMNKAVQFFLLALGFSLLAPSFAPAATFDEVDDGRAVYTREGNAVITNRAYTKTPAGASGADFITESSIGNTTYEKSWIHHRVSPKNDEELVGVVGGSGNMTTLHAFRRPAVGDPFSALSVASAETIGAVGSNYNYCPFDLAYEQRSGDALLVFRGGDDDRLLYRTLSGGSLSGIGTIMADFGSRVLWVKLIPRPNSDEILILAADTSNLLRAWIWNGSSAIPTIKPDDFSAGGTDATGLIYNDVYTGHRSFDAAYLADGTLAVVFAVTGGSLIHARSINRNGSSPTKWGNLGQNPITADPAAYVVLASSPSGTYLAGAVVTTASETLHGLRWDPANPAASCQSPSGSTSKSCWYIQGPIANLVNDAVGSARLAAVDIAWIQTATEEQAIMAYSRNSVEVGFNWTRWMAVAGQTWAGGSVSTLDSTITAAVSEASQRLVSYNDYSRILLLTTPRVSGSATELRAGIYDGTSWYASDLQVGTSSSSSPSSFVSGGSIPMPLSGRPFDIALNRFLAPKLESAMANIPIRPGAVATPPLTITDLGGIIYNDVPGDTDGFDTADLSIFAPLGLSWDNTVTCVSVSGTAVSKIAAGTCPAGQVRATYQVNNDVVPVVTNGKLLLDVTQDFAIGDTLTLTSTSAGKYLLSGNETAGTLLTYELGSNVRPDVELLRDWDERYTATVQPRLVESLTLANHTLGQLTTNSLATAAQTTSFSLTNTPVFFRFNLTSYGGDVNLPVVQFPVLLSGIVAADITSPRLTRGDGTVYTGTVSAGTISFSSVVVRKTTMPASPPIGEDFVLSMDVANLVLGDSMSISFTTALTELGAANGVSSGVNLQTVPTVPSAIQGSASSTTHTVKGYSITLDPVKTAYQPGEVVDVGWAKVPASGTQAPGDAVNVDFLVNGTDSGDCGSSGITISPCAFTIPAVATPPNQGMMRVSDTAVSTSKGFSPAFTVLERLWIDDPATQVSNGLIQTSGIGGDPFGLSNVPLLRVSLRAEGGEVGVSNLAFNLSAGGSSAVANGSVGQSNFQLIDDATGNPVIDDATGNPIGASSNGTFNSIALRIPGGTSRTLTLRANLVDLQPGEILTVLLPTSGVGSNGMVSATPLTADRTSGELGAGHTVSTYIITRPAGTDEPLVATRNWATGGSGTVPITFTAYGNAAATGITMEYRADGGAWTALSCTAQPSGQCDAEVPDAVSNNIELRVSDGTHTAQSNLFRIAGIIQVLGVGSLALPEGPTWILGYTHQVSWEQLGSFTTTSEVVDMVASWREIDSLPISAPALGTFTMDCINLGVNCAAGYPSDGFLNAQVRVRPADALSTQGDRFSGNFAVRPAFLDIQPTTGEVQTGVSTAISWTRLPGTEGATSTFPINFVTVRVLDAANTVLSTVASNVSNSGSRTWTFSAAEKGTARHIQICDSARPTICASSGNFDVIDVTLTIERQSQPGVAVTSLILDEDTVLSWQGVTGGNVELFLQAADGTVLMDVLDNVMPVDSTTAATNTPVAWTVPTTLTTPLTGVHVRLHRPAGVAGADIIIDTAPFDIRNQIQSVIVSPTPVLTDLASGADPANDTTISWAALGPVQAQLWLMRQGDAAYQPLSVYGATGADNVNGSSYLWTTINGIAKTPQASVRVTQIGDAANVFAESAPFAIRAQIGTPVVKNAAGVVKAVFNINDPAELPLGIEWLLPRGPVASVRIRLLNNGGQEIVLPVTITNTATDTVAQSYGWTPTSTDQDIRVELCDADDLNACTLSTPFTVGGVSISSPVLAQRFVVGASGVMVTPIQWKPVSGSNTTARLEYQISGGPLQTIIASVPSNEGVTNTYSNWTVPVSFAGLSDQVAIVVTDNGNALSAQSPLFTIAGQIVINSVLPNGTHAVGDSIDLTYSAYGAMSTATIEYSSDGGSTWKDGPDVVPAAGAFNGWVLPMDAIAQNLLVRIRDISPGHPLSQSPTVSITVTPSLTVTAPDASPWIANETHAIQWSATGLIDKIQLLYSVNGGAFTPLAGTPQPNGMICNGTCDDDAGNTSWASSFDWTTADPGLPRDAGSYAPASLVIKVVDVSTNHAPQEWLLPSRQLAYVGVLWQIEDPVTGSPLSGLNVTETNLDTGISSWNVTNGTVLPNSPFLNYSGVLRYYGVGRYTTTWSHPAASDSAVISAWQVDRTLIEDLSGPVFVPNGVLDVLEDAIRKEALLELDANKSTQWNVRMATQFVPGVSPAPNAVNITGWLEKRGVLYAQVTQMDIAISNASGLVRNLTSSTPDTYGVFRIAWDLTDNSGNPVDETVPYFLQGTVINDTGGTLTSGEAVDLTIPATIFGLAGGTSGGSTGVTLTELQTELDPLKTDVTAIRTIVSPLSQQITDTQGAIQADIATTSAALGAQVAAVQTTADAIQADTTQINTKVDGVQAYLSDPTAGLPAVLANQTTIQDQLMAQRRGGILNRALDIEQGTNAVIRYRSVSDAVAPRISIVDPLGASIVSSLPMAQVAPNLYEYTLTGAALGEYKVTVNEDPSTDSAGTLDGAVVTVSLPRATGDDVNSITSQLSALSTQLTNVEANLDGKLTTIQSAMATATQVDAVIAATDALQAKWGALSAADLQAELAAIQTLIGLPANGSVSADIAAIAAATSAIDYTGRFDAIDGQLDSIETIVAAISGGGSGGSGGGDLTTIQATLDSLVTDVGALQTQVGDPAQQASVDALTVTADAIQAGMARDVDLQTALTRLDALQTAMAGLDTKLGTPAFGSIAADVADVKAAITAIPGSIDYSARFDAVDAAMGGLATQVGDPAQRADLAAASAALTLIQTDMARDTDMQVVRTDVASLITSLTALDARVGDPAQQASLDGAIAALGTIQADMAQETSVQSIVTAVGSLQADMAALSAAVGTPAQAAALAAVDGKIDAVTAAIAALPGATDYTPLLTTLQGGVDALATTLGTPASGSVAGDIAAIPAPVDYTATLTTMQTDLANLAAQVSDPAQAARLEDAMTELSNIRAQLASIPGATDYSANFTALDAAMAGLNSEVAALKADVGQLPKTGSADEAVLLAKLADLEKQIQSAAGSSAAVGLSQAAYSSASEALKILQQIQTNIQQNGGTGGAQVPVMLGKFGEQMKQVSTTISVLPGQISEDAEVLAQIKKLTEQAKGIASDKGYQFDSLYEISENQAGDVKTMRNQVEELKALVEIQRSLLEKNMNQPVIKTWFEAR